MKLLIPALLLLALLPLPSRAVTLRYETPESSPRILADGSRFTSNRTFVAVYARRTGHHWRLDYPMHSELRVTSLRTGRSIVARVCDTRLSPGLEISGRGFARLSGRGWRKRGVERVRVWRAE